MMTRLEGMLSLLCQQGFQPLERDYYQAWLHFDQEVRHLVHRLLSVKVPSE
jgi:hypothetical protein